jgi:hypothetical protein
MRSFFIAANGMLAPQTKRDVPADGRSTVTIGQSKGRRPLQADSPAGSAYFFVQSNKYWNNKSY